ncbi:MAG: hypothetical protein HY700_18545 [Gemmatimonadetes bacterium]|nr:hypothetical protein [Gemmatimonadota bacterium]
MPKRAISERPATLEARLAEAEKKLTDLSVLVRELVQEVAMLKEEVEEPVQ